eukprot:TRINITY_DN6814_c0_g1_i2.p1 TRINITY_DN6814_c0_g1~~TRINITY_DN6814_c0_g1_i2.p1  ORF type:complete len:181 (+),score=28.96 TRINITY_DN6814_c0_g1_i2:108-650(+)
MSTSDVLNRELFEQLMACQDDSDPTFVLDIVTMYYNSARQHFPEMEANLSQDNYEDLFNTAHTLKGSAGGVGAMILHDLMEDLKRGTLTLYSDTTHTHTHSLSLYGNPLWTLLFLSIVSCYFSCYPPSTTASKNKDKALCGTLIQDAKEAHRLVSSELIKIFAIEEELTPLDASLYEGIV